MACLYTCNSTTICVTYPSKTQGTLQCFTETMRGYSVSYPPSKRLTAGISGTLHNISHHISPFIPATRRACPASLRHMHHAHEIYNPPHVRIPHVSSMPTPSPQPYPTCSPPSPSGPHELDLSVRDLDPNPHATSRAALCSGIGHPTPPRPSSTLDPITPTV
ncbi:hypothetical protein M011DRAFT_287947 [Sporormia fimetaria CBS 119925]|uniref:Uncharacterized protein n=1 Tax=Sporormia fimetaria CBS 119925 TaxID=1340428 RepID=A0A6A6UY01_9PLEO|nr:hypothetical protein M011DRAFT_287947 [Sporormia fimetaria CBS 119925]